MRIRIKGGRVVDPANQIDKIADVFVDGNRIAAVGRAPRGFAADRLIDAKGLVVIPGLVDLSARIGDPDSNHKATIDTELRAAAASGVTTLCCPPDTNPVIDTPAVVELIHQRAAKVGLARVLCLGALTSGLEGERLAECHALKLAGCVGVSNARAAVANTEVMRRALEYAATCGQTVFIQPEDPWLAGQGHVHEGPVSSRLGLPGIPETAETVALARDLLLIEQIGARVHFCRLSSARSLAMLADAQRKGMPVTADVSIAHLFLTDTDVGEFDSACHVRPPLRPRRDRDALRKALAKGVLAAVCSDHQPQDADAKKLPFDATEPGISALETWLPLTLRLVEEDILSLPQAIAAVTCRPAEILGLNAGTLTPGAVADICIVDPTVKWSLNEEAMLSAGTNTPFLGKPLKGRVRRTLYNGRVVYEHKAAS